MSGSQQKDQFPPQSQPPPGKQGEMVPEPRAEMKEYRGSGKLQGKVAIVTGADSGIGRAVAIGFAKEGADVAVMYLNEHEDAEITRKYIEEAGRKALLIDGDIGSEAFCRDAVRQVVAEFGRVDILVNNAAMQRVQETIEEITEEQLVTTFRTNIFSQFFMVKAAVSRMKEGATIINTTSVTAFRGQSVLLDYASTKGAILAFTRALAQNLAEKKIRVNAVAPGPIWTPLIPSSFPPEKVKSFGSNTLLGRAGQPDEAAPSYIFLASEDASFFTGHVLHPDGGNWMGD
jgi:NAD(P)-dependent dehydrogenase (short-subunit alcohol dehydrogenase family)